MLGIHISVCMLSKRLFKEVTSGWPVTRDQSRDRRPAHFFFDSASQFSTTDIGWISPFFTRVLIRNRWPSRVTS
jgi:hypothetical protein